MQYCNNCRQMVMPKKDYDVAVLLFLCLCCCCCLAIIYYLSKGDVCPMCKSINWGVQSSQENVSSHQGPLSAKETKFCFQCGGKIPSDAIFCPNCGSKNQ